MALKLNMDRTVVTFFALFLCVYFLEAIGGFFMTSAVVSIEKQFQIPSKISGMMVSAGDFGYIPTVVFVSYLGGKGNRAKWIGGGCMLIAVANVLISASNFLFPVERVVLNNSQFEHSIERDLRRYTAGPELLVGGLPIDLRGQIRRSGGLKKALDECERLAERNTSSILCRQLEEALHDKSPASLTEVENLRAMTATSYAFCDRALNGLRRMIESIRCIKNENSYLGPTATIFFGLFLLGIGRTMPFSLGLPLIDDNVKKQNLPIYFAGMFFIRILGPVIGLMMGAFFNKFYYTFDAPRGLTPRDPMWIGRWWCGFLVMGLLLFGPSLGLFCFKTPKSYHEEEKEGSELKEDLLDENGKPKKQRRRLALVDRHVEKTADGKSVVPESFSEKVHDFFVTVKSVLAKPVFHGLLVGRIIDVMAFKGFFVFLPKYLEIHFGIPQYKINSYMGLIGVIGFAIGVTAGSFLMRYLKLEGRKAAMWVAVCSAMAACLSFLNAGVACQSTMSALGVLAQSNALNTTQSCSNYCSCDGVPIYPVCDRQGAVFYSPCHAGCPAPDPAAFAALDPALPPLFTNCSCVTSDPLREASRDFCETDDCNYKVKLYFLNMAISGIFGGLGVTPGMLIMLRSVPAKHRSVSLGFNGFLVSLLATLPSPIIWGTIIDTFCVQWERKCDGQGACSLYATEGLRLWMHGIYGGLRLLALVTDIYVVYHAKNLRILGDAEDDAPQPPGDLTPADLELQKPAEDQLDELPMKSPSGSRKSSHRHKRSASREIIGFLTDDGPGTVVGELERRKSTDYVAGTIANYSSNM